MQNQMDAIALAESGDSVFQARSPPEVDVNDDSAPVDSTAGVPDVCRTLESELYDAAVSDPSDHDYWNLLFVFRQPTIRDKDYTFLTYSSTVELRIIARETKMKQVGVKNSVIWLSMLNGQKAVPLGEEDWDGVFQGEFRRLLSTPKNQSISVRVSPSDSQITSYAPAVRVRSPATTKTAAMSSHEFARLIEILLEHYEVRSGLLQSDRYSQESSSRDATSVMASRN